MTLWRLAPQEVTPESGSFTAIAEVVVTKTAIDALGEAAVLGAVAMLARQGITRRLDYFQVLLGENERRLYAVDDDGSVTLMLPEDW